MQQSFEQQKVVDKYRSMMKDRIDFTPLESNPDKSDPAVISHDNSRQFMTSKDPISCLS